MRYEIEIFGDLAYVEEDPSYGKDMTPLIPPQALCPITTISFTCQNI